MQVFFLVLHVGDVMLGELARVSGRGMVAWTFSGLSPRLSLPSPSSPSAQLQSDGDGEW